MLSMKPGNPKLLEGNERFVESNTAYRSLAGGQHPHAVVLACSDSRVAPIKITDSELGELFEIRTIGGAIDQSSIGSIEYPILHLGVKELAIIGHTRCGAVTAAQKKLAAGIIGGMDGGKGSAFDNTIAWIARGISKNSSQNIVDLTHAVIDNAMAQIQKLVDSSEIVREAMAKGSLRINVYLYDISTGKLRVVKNVAYNERSGALSFEDVSE